jgi:O-antigen ligase
MHRCQLLSHAIYCKMNRITLSDIEVSNKRTSIAGFILLSGTFFVISFPRTWSLYALGLFLLAGLIYSLFRLKNTISIFKTKWYLIIPPIVFFFIQFISLVIQNGAISLIEDRLMFLLVPLFGFSLLCNSLNGRPFKLVIGAYILGITIVSIFLISRLLYVVLISLSEGSIGTSLVGLDSYVLFSGEYSILEHPSYLSMKIVWIIVLIMLISDEIKLIRPVRIFLLVLLSINLLFLASKAGIILWVILAGIAIYSYGSRGRFRKILVMLLLPMFLIITFSLSNRISRIDKFVNIMKEGLSAESIDWKNLDQRTREWHSALQLIKEKPIFGHGLVNVEERMVKEYRKNGWEDEAKLNLNAHNQFLETQMTFGIAGSLSLFWMLLTPIVFRKRLRYPSLAVAFVLMFSFFLLFESMLNRQWGIMFFTLFYCLLVFPSKDDIIEIENVITNHQKEMSKPILT